MLFVREKLQRWIVKMWSKTNKTLITMVGKRKKYWLFDWMWLIDANVEWIFRLLMKLKWLIHKILFFCNRKKKLLTASHYNVYILFIFSHLIFCVCINALKYQSKWIVNIVMATKKKSTFYIKLCVVNCEQ